MSTLKNKYLAKYSDEAFDIVEGWVSVELLPIFDFLDSLPLNKSGGVLEIGVHHGLFYLLLNQLSEKDALSYAVDVFDYQNLNIDHSGSGDKTVFKSNMLKFDRHHGSNTTIIEGDSTDSKLWSTSDIPMGTMKFISIDGGHTAEHTVNDLKLSSQYICNEGVVILDDILNYHWLGVIEGYFKFMASSPSLVPFAIGHNKLFMCKLGYQSTYFDYLAKSKFCTKHVQSLGYTLVAL